MAFEYDAISLCPFIKSPYHQNLGESLLLASYWQTQYEIRMNSSFQYKVLCHVVHPLSPLVDRLKLMIEKKYGIQWYYLKKG